MQYHLNGFHPGDPDVSDPAPAWRGKELPSEVDVLIAGCGPAGLCLAAQLAREPSIKVMIVEPKSGPIEKGQADGISVRSMEMFEAFGFADRLKRESVWINETTFWGPDKRVPGKLTRLGRVQDVADGLSEMPHVLVNQARIHDMFLNVMRNAPSRLEPDYGITIAGLKVDPDRQDYPVAVTLEHCLPDSEGQRHELRARYVIGCDGARSTVREAIGGALHGDSAQQAWGVMDVLAVSDFPDLRMKSIIQSQDHGSILFLPREGGYLIRLYVEMGKLDVNERVAQRTLAVEDVIAKAQAILHPFSFDVKEVVWSSIYEVGQRLTDTFDDVPAEERSTRFPRVILAGDACHTHSPKAGQGMNVSMGDTFNLGWKLISVLTGRSEPALLHSYTAERQATAKGLIDFDHRWSRVIGGRDYGDGDEDMPLVQREFMANGQFTAGLTVVYPPSAIIGEATWQGLATGFPIGARFHSAPVIRLADARPMHLGHVATAGVSWLVFLFAPAEDQGQPGQAVADLCSYLASDPASPLVRYRRTGEDIDALVDVRAVFQQGFRDIEHAAMPDLLRPAKGVFGLRDHEKVFCADPKQGDIFSMRGIDRARGCALIVRPDQHVAHVLPLEAREEFARFFSGFFIDA